MSITPLSNKHCVPCEGDDPPLTKAQAQDLLPHIPGWSMNDSGTMLARTFQFPDFASALKAATRVGALAEEEGHHPDLSISWGKLSITLTTHAVQGLSENDFILAVRISNLALESSANS